MKLRFIGMLLLLVLALFYTCTAIIRGDGPGEELVFAPFHGLYPFYSNREGGKWDGNRSPGYCLRMYYSCYETTPAPWLVVYMAGYFIGLPCVAILSILQQRRAEKECRTRFWTRLSTLRVSIALKLPLALKSKKDNWQKTQTVIHCHTWKQQHLAFD